MADAISAFGHLIRHGGLGYEQVHMEVRPGWVALTASVCREEEALAVALYHIAQGGHSVRHRHGRNVIALQPERLARLNTIEHYGAEVTYRLIHSRPDGVVDEIALQCLLS